MPIQILSEKVIDQIAAGEVLERPSHLVKELIENSIDAGSDQIDVEFEDGGRQVTVRDNGHGIPKDELTLALRRHATSKIFQTEDLYSIRSFGFRGEALASVAAVSRLTVTSKAKDQADAFVLRSEYGYIESPIKGSGSLGTTIVVKDLFQNVPARLKFLKSPAAESGQIKLVLKALALAHPHVQFRVRSKGELMFYWAKANPLQRAQEVLGVEPLFSILGEESGIQVQAFFASPDQTLQQNRGLWIFVQDRWVQDRALMAAVMESYRNLLMHGEYPQVALSVKVPPDFVDVNVHPTKSQVKFANSQTVFRAVTHTLRPALEKAPWLRNSALGARNRDLEMRTEDRGQSQNRFQDPMFSSVQYPEKAFPLAQVRTPSETYTATESDSATGVDSPRSGQIHWQKLEVIGQADQTYIVAQSTEEFFLLDQHAAHERIVFERLMAQWKHGKFDIQNLLIPLALDLSRLEVEAIETQLSQLHSVGLDVEKQGPESLVLNSIPAFISENAVVATMRKLAQDISQNGGSWAFEQKVGDIFASMACHSVVRAGQTLSRDEMKSLLMQMDEFPLSSFCPHGRPVSVSWKFSELERKFGRIV